ncbi:MAG: type II toxin-antitoxin system VapC family toxin [Spirochaetaceae bacterium]|nr:MAG: type II toxin-antitoxin system VapC family toxin [Spirochaetaceae bacterium]
MAHALIVLDASAALALVLTEDEEQEVADLISDRLSINGQIFVPGLFWHELGNGLLMAERSRRIAQRSSSKAVSYFVQLPIITHQQTDPLICSRIMGLARENQLNYYDASYLELALRFEAPLKSFDPHLQNLKSSFPLIL